MVDKKNNIEEKIESIEDKVKKELIKILNNDDAHLSLFEISSKFKFDFKRLVEIFIVLRMNKHSENVNIVSETFFKNELLNGALISVNEVHVIKMRENKVELFRKVSSMILKSKMIEYIFNDDFADYFPDIKPTNKLMTACVSAVILKSYYQNREESI